jgi:hypothetical protein
VSNVHHIVDEKNLIDLRWKYIPKTVRKVTEKLPPFPIEIYSGKYWCDGYGDQIQFSVPSNASDSEEGNPCKKVQEAYEKIDASTGVTYEWQLQASWPRIWSSHFRLISLGDNRCEHLLAIN